VPVKSPVIEKMMNEFDLSGKDRSNEEINESVR
jgi:hypothetical protein